MPNSKTAAAITAQAPVLVDNLRAAHDGKELPAKYDGYASCPLLTGHDELMCVLHAPLLLLSRASFTHDVCVRQARRVQVRWRPERDVRAAARVARRPQHVLLPPQEGLLPARVLVRAGQGAPSLFLVSFSHGADECGVRSSRASGSARADRSARSTTSTSPRRPRLPTRPRKALPSRSRTHLPRCLSFLFALAPLVHSLVVPSLALACILYAVLCHL